MSAATVEHHLERAFDFLKGMELTRTDRMYWNSAALLAIHSAISYCDALRIGMGESSLSSGNHADAAERLRKALSARRFDDTSGIAHFRFLISKKDAVSYGSRRIEHAEYETLYTKAERFARWAYRAGVQLKIEGWQYDDQ